jgi:cytochrome c peroxidase
VGGFFKKHDSDPQPEPFKFEVPSYFPKKYTIPADNPVTEQGVALGRMLFYEKKLSLDNTIACANCHQQRFAFTDGQAFSTGVQGKTGRRSSMSIANVLWLDRFFWDGRADSLEEQALVPIQDSLEMHQSLSQVVSKLQQTSIYPEKFTAAFGSSEITANRIAQALAQFERTLISSNSRFDQYARGETQLTAQQERGRTLFFTHPVPETNLRGGNCGDCHGGYLVTLNTFNNNGLNASFTDMGLGAITGNAFDNGKMRAPTLRNIALTAPYMHDGRFNTLEEVLDHYNEHIQPSATLDPLIINASNEVKGTSLMLTGQEKKDIIVFLQALTDSTFIQDQRFSNPFDK